MLPRGENQAEPALCLGKLGMKVGIRDAWWQGGERFPAQGRLAPLCLPQDGCDAD